MWGLYGLSKCKPHQCCFEGPFLCHSVVIWPYGDFCVYFYIGKENETTYI